MTTIEPTGLVMAQNLLTLNDVFPDALNGNGIFSRLTDFEFNPDTQTASYLDFDYFGNYSGDKIASKLIHKLVDTNGILSNKNVLKLANVIKAKFSSKWEQLWLSYAEQPWFDNINIEEKVSTEESGEKNKETHGEFNETTGLTSKTTDDKTGSDTTTSTRTGSMTSADTGSTTDNHKETGQRIETLAHTGSIADQGNANGSEFSFGFNTTGDTGNLVNKDTTTDGNTRTFTNTDTTTITPFSDIEDKRTHGKTTTDTYNNLKDETKIDYNSTIEKNDKRDGTRDNTNDVTVGETSSNQSEITKSIKGYDMRRFDKTKSLIDLFAQPDIFPFFETVYADIDSVLCIPLFK